MLTFENGEYRKVTKQDTEGNMVLAMLLAFICLLPVWLIWKFIELFFSLIFNNKNK
jgi:hypothetical protein